MMAVQRIVTAFIAGRTILDISKFGVCSINSMMKYLKSVELCAMHECDFEEK